MTHVDVGQVRDIIARGEGLHIEFKRARRAKDLNDTDLVEAVACMSNGGGGHVLLGVEDDGTITGTMPRHENITDPDRLTALIRHRTKPWLETSVNVVPIDGHDVVVIEVPTMSMPVGTTGGVFKRRTITTAGLPECVPYGPHEVVFAGLSLRGLDYAEVAVTGARPDDLDPRHFDRFRELCAQGKGDHGLSTSTDDEILRALRLVNPESPSAVTLGAILLFGTTVAVDRFVPTAECQFQDLRPGASQVNETLRGSIFSMLHEIEARMSLRNTEVEVLVGVHRVGIPLVPIGSFREAVANALVHRDYTELGPINVQLDEHELRVTSPGGFPPGITIDNVLEQSKPRSVVLAEAFKRAGVVDRRGSGVGTMFTALLRAGRGGPSFAMSTARSVSVSLPTSASDLDMVRFILAFEEGASERLTLAAIRVLYEVKSGGPATLGDLAEGLVMVPTTTRSVVTQLVEHGLLELRGRGRSSRCHLAAAFYRLAEDRNAYVRVRPFDELQQIQLVLGYVQEYGSITRGQAAQLLRVDPRDARVLLRRLTEQGRLELLGERRGAHYVAGPALS